MTEDELLDLYKTLAYLPNDAEGNPLTPFGNFCAGYKAHAELADKEKAELQAQINELREALEETKTFLDFNIELAQTDEFGNVEPANSYSYELYRYVCFINESLAKTAPQCLQEHDNEVIERCAKVAENYNLLAGNIIRARKGKQNE